jgi:hypothetical protein
VQDNAADLALMRRLDELHLKWPFYGSRKLTLELRAEGQEINRKRVQRLMRQMGNAYCATCRFTRSRSLSIVVALNAADPFTLDDTAGRAVVRWIDAPVREALMIALAWCNARHNRGEALASATRSAG